MSTPTTSTGPTPPSGTSNPVTMRGWFKAIIDWIVGLSPAGATKYDSGWVAVPTAAGWGAASPVQARRIGRTVWWQGIVQAGSANPPLVVPEGGIPPEMRSTTHNPVFPLASTGTVPLRVTVQQNGSVALAGAVPIGTYVYLTSIRYTVD